jgi:uncharacterized protein (DUF2336 family)
MSIAMTGEGEPELNANGPAVAPLEAPSFGRPDIVRRFLAWAQRAEEEERAQAASALARAYLLSNLTPPMRAEAELAMTTLLDDPSALVRRALAEALGSASQAPRHLVLALAGDQSDVAAAVLQRSPVLTDADLVECAAVGDVVVQCALARRPNLSPGMTAALAEVGQRDAILALVGNRNVELRASALDRIFARFGDDAEVREALLQRRSLPGSLRARIAVATARDLRAASAQWLPRERAERIAREACDQAICLIASSCHGDERAGLVRSLLQCGALTPALLLRSLLGGERDLFDEALAELSGLPLRRVAAFTLDPRGAGFAALANRAGLKSCVLPVFAAALAAIDTDVGEDDGELALVQRVIDECEQRDDPALGKVLALLWRFAAEAARAEAAGFAREAVARQLPPSLDFSPANDDAGEPLMLTMEAASPRTGPARLGQDAFGWDGHREDPRAMTHGDAAIQTYRSGPSPLDRFPPGLPGGRDDDVRSIQSHHALKFGAPPADPSEDLAPPIELPIELMRRRVARRRSLEPSELRSNRDSQRSPQRLASL